MYGEEWRYLGGGTKENWEMMLLRVSIVQKCE
jgi:hypothetical protein